MPCRDNSAIPGQTGSLLSQLPTIGLCRTEIAHLGDFEAAREASSDAAWPLLFAPYQKGGANSMILRTAAPFEACVLPSPHGRSERRRPKLSSSLITGRAARAPGRAWACLYICHIQSCGSWPARLNQSSIWAVESTWSSCLPFGRRSALAGIRRATPLLLADARSRSR